MFQISHATERVSNRRHRLSRRPQERYATTLTLLTRRPDMDEFERDLAVNTKDVETARASLVERLTVLTDEDLRRGRRGGWSIQEVLRHVIDAEVAYTKVLGFLRSTPVELANARDDDVASAQAAISALGVGRERSSWQYSTASMRRRSTNCVLLGASSTASRASWRWLSGLKGR
jgi:hypothetical protein